MEFSFIACINLIPQGAKSPSNQSKLGGDNSAASAQKTQIFGENLRYALFHWNPIPYAVREVVCLCYRYRQIDTQTYR